MRVNAFKSFGRASLLKLRSGYAVRYLRTYSDALISFSPKFLFTKLAIKTYFVHLNILIFFPGCHCLHLLFILFGSVERLFEWFKYCQIMRSLWIVIKTCEPRINILEHNSFSLSDTSWNVCPVCIRIEIVKRFKVISKVCIGPSVFYVHQIFISAYIYKIIGCED